MILLIHHIKKWERGGNDKNVNTRKQGKQQNDFALIRGGLGGRLVHWLVES